MACNSYTLQFCLIHMPPNFGMGGCCVTVRTLVRLLRAGFAIPKRMRSARRLVVSIGVKCASQGGDIICMGRNKISTGVSKSCEADRIRIE